MFSKERAEEIINQINLLISAKICGGLVSMVEAEKVNDALFKLLTTEEEDHG